MPYAYPLLDPMLLSYKFYPSADVTDVCRMRNISIWVARSAWIAWVRGVGRETIIEGCYAGDVAQCGHVSGGGEVFDSGISAFGVLGGIAPGAAVDVAVARLG